MAQFVGEIGDTIVFPDGSASLNTAAWATIAAQAAWLNRYSWMAVQLRAPGESLVQVRAIAPGESPAGASLNTALAAARLRAVRDAFIAHGVAAPRILTPPGISMTAPSTPPPVAPTTPAIQRPGLAPGPVTPPSVVTTTPLWVVVWAAQPLKVGVETTISLLAARSAVEGYPPPGSLLLARRDWRVASQVEPQLRIDGRLVSPADKTRWSPRSSQMEWQWTITPKRRSTPIQVMMREFAADDVEIGRVTLAQTALPAQVNMGKWAAAIAAAVAGLATFLASIIKLSESAGGVSATLARILRRAPA